MVKKTNGDRLNLNSCTAAELSTGITGLGPKTAAALVASREDQGPFLSLEDVKNRKLISVGSAKLRALKAAKVAFSSAEAARPSANAAGSSVVEVASSSDGSSKSKPFLKLAKALKKVFGRTSSSESSHTTCTKQPPAIAAAHELPGCANGPGPLEQGPSLAHLSAPSVSSTDALPDGSARQHASAISHSGLQQKADLSKPDISTAASHDIVATTAALPWWHDTPNAPFPAEFQNPRHKNEHVFARIAADRSGRLKYRGRHMTPKEAADLRLAWELRYPKTDNANVLGNGRESAEFRKKATCKPRIRQACWSALADLEGSQAIREVDPGLAALFRSDAYGNVVSIQAAKNAVCAFDADHLFPWCRGGLSLPANLTAVHWGANRYVKSAKIPSALSDDEVERLQCGLSVSLFLRLHARRSEEARTRVPAFDARFKALLLTSYSIPWELARQVNEANVFAYLNNAYEASLQDISS
ncbi:hypothetical protein WJX74_003684 [Apatococcus lobatus]|uniref:HNH nuclease domain-containing protein n=1 Tax=Apatococcus lobatus TaxID=904363 RepID=A0AAW1S5Z5_9CHLO